MLAIHRAGWRKVFRMVQAPDRDIDSSWLLLTFPAQRRSADATELPHHARRRSVLSGLPPGVLELVGRDKEPRHRLCTRCSPAVRTVADKYLVGRTDSSVADRSAHASTDEFVTVQGCGPVKIVRFGSKSEGQPTAADQPVLSLLRRRRTSADGMLPQEL